MQEFYIRFPSDIRYLHLATSFCRELCAKVPHKGTLDVFLKDMELCISEACTNAIQYGTQSSEMGYISVLFSVSPDKVIIRIGDRGVGFDLEEIPLPDLETLPERGYGLYIIKAKMDEVRYVRDREGNYLEMTRYFPAD
jgi:serine/threonine-protein kinase RsbW